MNLSDKKVLVAGGAGFIGSNTVDALIAGGADVAVVDNLLTGCRENVDPRARFYNVNVADAEIERIIDIEQPDIVYYFAYYVYVPKSVENPLLDMDALTGVLRILKKARHLKFRIIFPSSGFLYGNNVALPAKEEYPVDPVSPYVVSKSAIENYLKFYNRVFGVPYVILRYAAIYGPRQITGAMADYIRKLGNDKQAEMWGDGNKTRDYVFIEDVVRANLLAIDVPNDYPFPLFNIGTGIETTLNVLYKKIAGILDKEARPAYLPDRPGEQLRYCLDNTKARNVLGWKPTVSLDEGLKLTIQYAMAESFQI